MQIHVYISISLQKVKHVNIWHHYLSHLHWIIDTMYVILSRICESCALDVITLAVVLFVFTTTYIHTINKINEPHKTNN